MRTVWSSEVTRRSCPFVAAVAFAAAGCTSAASQAPYFGKVDPPAGQRLRYISGSEPESLDPQVGTGQPEARIYLALFEGLTSYDPVTAEPIPGLAERWEANEDNTAFTFHMRPDARWSDGTPITAHDVVYTMRRGLSPALAARNAYMAYEILYAQAFNEGAVFARDRATGAYLMDGSGHRLTLPGDAAARDEALADPSLAAVRSAEFVPVSAEDVGVEALDDHTVRITMMRPVPYTPGLVGHQFFMPVPRQAVDAYGDAWTRPGHIVTSGPFTLTTWKPYDELVVSRSATYWDAARVRLEEIVFYPVEELTTAMNLYKAGVVDAVHNHTVPAAWIDSIRGLEDYMDEAELACEYYTFNTTRAPMNDVRVRKAFNAAIDKEALAAFRRVSKPLTGFVPIGLFPGYPHPRGDAFDPVRARALLAEAGFRNAAGDYDPSTFPIRDVELLYNTAESNRQVAEFVQAQWKQNLDLTVPLKNMEWRTFLTVRESLDYSGMARAGWVGDYLDPFTFLDLFSTPRGNNGSGWFEDKYLQMLRAANRERDPNRRFEQLASAEAYLLDVQPVIPLQIPATNWMKKPYVKGMYANPVTLHAWKFVYIEHDPARWGREGVTTTQ
jgi:ABC-type oligopeptide transport system substrate-binding subunit